MDRVLNGGQERQILFVEKIAAAERSLDGANAGVGECDIAGVFIQREMTATAEKPRDAIHLISQRLFARFTTRDHERDASFVDEDGVRFVDHRGREWPLHLLVGMERQAVAQKIEPDLISSSVGNIASVGMAALFTCCTHALLEMTDG